MIVDDDYDFLESIQLLLLNDGHDTIPISNGKYAIEQYNEFEPDLVLLDIRMPGIDGYETFLHMIRNDADARIIFTSAYDLSSEQYKKAKNQSLSGILSKPIEFTKLRRIITKHAK